MVSFWWIVYSHTLVGGLQRAPDIHLSSISFCGYIIEQGSSRIIGRIYIAGERLLLEEGERNGLVL